MYDHPYSSKWYEHRPEGVTENNEVKLLWDFPTQTGHEIHHRRPNITPGKEQQQSAVPGDSNVEKKEREKNGKIPRFCKGNI